MKVLIVSPIAYPHIGGVEKHIHELAKSLIETGNDVTVVTQECTDSKIKKTVFEGVSYISYPVMDSSHYGISFALASWVKKYSKDYDVVHLQALHKPLSVWLMLFSLRNHKRIVLTPHYHGGGHTTLANLMHIFYKPIAKLALKRVNKIIAVSDSEKELIQRDFPKNSVDVIPNGITRPEFEEPKIKEKFTFLSVGRLEKYKRVDLTVSSAPKESNVIIIGDGPDKERVSKLASEAEVFVLGRVSEAELNSWWHTADAYVSMSEKEAYGLTMGEAISVGLPVIVSDIPAHRYVASLADEKAVILFAKNSNELKEHMNRLFADKIKGYPHLVYNWSQVAEETERVYKSI